MRGGSGVGGQGLLAIVLEQGTRNPELGTLKPKLGTLNSEPGTLNPDH